MSRTQSLAAARQSVSAKLRGIEIPSAWISSTIATAQRDSVSSTKSARSSRRRSLSKALRVVGSL
jgi:hypothetical protein